VQGAIAIRFGDVELVVTEKELCSTCLNYHAHPAARPAMRSRSGGSGPNTLLPASVQRDLSRRQFRKEGPQVWRADYAGTFRQSRTAGHGPSRPTSQSAWILMTSRIAVDNIATETMT